MVIGLRGYARSGKDAVAEYLVARHGFRHLKFADRLRECLIALDPIIGTDNGDEPVRLSDALSVLSYEEVKGLYPELRLLMQRMGTQVIRHHFGEDAWVDLLLDDCGDATDDIVISDMRFPNEDEAVLDLGGHRWLIERPGVVPANAHCSETAIDDVAPDLRLMNDGTLEELYARVDALLVLARAAEAA